MKRLVPFPQENLIWIKDAELPRKDIEPFPGHEFLCFWPALLREIGILAPHRLQRQKRKPDVIRRVIAFAGARPAADLLPVH